MLRKDKSQLKRNVEQIGFQLALLARVSADLTDSGRQFHTVGPATKKVRSPRAGLTIRGPYQRKAGPFSHTHSQDFLWGAFFPKKVNLF